MHLKISSAKCQPFWLVLTVSKVVCFLDPSWEATIRIYQKKYGALAINLKNTVWSPRHGTWLYGYVKTPLLALPIIVGTISCHVRTASANKRKRYTYNVFSYWSKPLLMCVEIEDKGWTLVTYVYIVGGRTLLAESQFWIIKMPHFSKRTCVEISSASCLPFCWGLTALEVVCSLEIG